MAGAPKLDSLEERLMDHAKSFDSLLSLMPAEVYFGKDNSDQWQKKKQTKEERKAAKRAKLDPDNAKSAKDVLDEQAANARKRKREEEEGQGDPFSSEDAAEGGSVEQFAPDVSVDSKRGKKPKREAGDASQILGSEKKELNEEGRRKAKADRAREKKERKKAKVEKKAAKAEAKKERKQQEKALAEDEAAAVLSDNAGTPFREDDGAEKGSDGKDQDGDDMGQIDMDDGFAEEDLAATASSSSVEEASVFDALNQDSGSSSISSIVPPPADKTSSVTKIESSNNASASNNTSPTTAPAPPHPDSTPEALKARLAARIEALRTARKASDPTRAPQNRQELIESRRRKEEERKAHKKDLRRKAKEEEAAQRTETLARGSPLLSNTHSPLLSPGSPAAAGSPSSTTNDNTLSFSRITFPTGHRATPSLSTILPPGTRPAKGPSDPHTALLAAQHKQSRLSALSPTARDAASSKETWLHAQQRATGRGDRVRDDTSLLKKTLKRKEGRKKRSEREWGERVEGVKEAQAVKQRKREANLLKRREEKGGKGKGGKGKGNGKAGGGAGEKKKKARPGFEGSFKAKVSSSGGDKSGGGGERREKPRRR